MIEEYEEIVKQILREAPAYSLSAEEEKEIENNVAKEYAPKLMALASEFRGHLYEDYPLTIISDRYHGTYSKGNYLAFPYDYWRLPLEIDGDDIECMLFWDKFDGAVGRGSTPFDAIVDLMKVQNDRREQPTR